MLKAIISGTLLAAATPAFAYAGYYQTEAGSNLNGHNNDAFAAAPATFTLPGITISNVATPVPTITIRASNACCGNTTGIGHWGYNFGVIGPDYAAVPLFAHIVAHGSAAAETVLGSALASAQIDIIPDARSASKPIHIFGQSRVNFDGQPDLPGFAIDEVVAFTLTANYNGFVAGEAVASVGTRAYNFDGEHPTYGTGSASVYLDPFISIDPTWSAAHPGYSLHVEPGFGNSAAGGAVPEPASWALFVAGFGVVGAAARRRRVTVAAA